MFQNKINFVRKITLALAVVSMVLLAAGCGGGNKTSNEKVTLKIWKPFVDSDKMGVLIQAYKKAHPNVTIEYTKKNIENYEGDLLNALAAGNGPDIYSINNTWVPLYLDKIEPAPDKLYSLKEYKDAFVDVVYSDLVIDSKIYGTALWVDSLALYYNKDLMGTAGIATPPKTWSDLENYSRRIAQQNASGYFEQSGTAIGTYQNVNRAVDVVYLMMLQAGVVPWSSDRRSPQFSSSVSKNGKSSNPGTEAVTFYTSFANPSSENYNWNLESDYSIDAFANGRAAFLYGYSYTRAQINSKAPNLNYDVAAVPQYALGQPSVNYASYFAEVVSKQSKHKAAAWDFLKFISSQQALESYYAKDKQPSSRRDLIEKQTQDLEIGVFAHANLTAKSFFKFDEAKVDSIFGEMINSILLNGDTVPSALSRAQSQVSAVVSGRLF
jgi:multiple sugar transport system substrate-binding protein